jgi:hypothetical protein
MVESSGITIYSYPSYRTTDVPNGRLDETEAWKVGGCKVIARDEALAALLARVGVKSAQ